MNNTYANIFKIKRDDFATLPLPIVFMKVKESPPVFFRFVVCDKTEAEMPVEPFYKPISKFYVFKK